MMQGVVNQSCEAILSIVVQNDTKTKFTEAVIDTGFSGFLTLPSHIILELGLTWKGRDIATLGDGTSCIFDVYIADVIWDGEYVRIDINIVGCVNDSVTHHKSSTHLSQTSTIDGINSPFIPQLIG